MVVAHNAADEPIAADISRNHAVINRASVVFTRNAADPLTARDICIDEREVFNRAAVCAEQTDVIIVARYG